ncbi:hypothetical protein A2442_01145 [Candidatus Campbellbacteria bacterium RIFOXYC2_FULL_35_25]|uniref:DUF7793 domain-containing protein n=1 Tax=Candidatus Campbellbacteria bacterium RIFOXYC2_FULL_35_25 TaxID=1797582 RepID=A0A1F5EIX1_9BACT|nr:MAG: hypothetical protein A2442_01145 [Candidatus Campbellbacteria bacterium RIFOXYC2_FULL_35_25]
MNDFKQKKSKNKVWMEENIVYYILSTEVDEQEAILLNDIGGSYINSGQASYVLIGLQKQSSKFSSSARKIWVRFLQNENIKRVAMFGGNVVVRTLASFVIAATGKKNIKFFSEKDKALEWLLGK